MNVMLGKHVLCSVVTTSVRVLNRRRKQEIHHIIPGYTHKFPSVTYFLCSHEEVLEHERYI